MSGFIPQVGVRGIYTLAPPFQDDLIVKVAYQCTAVRTLRELATSGQDPFALYYMPHSIDKSKFDQDVLDDVCLVTLQAGDGESVFYIPSSYIVRAPQIGGVPYTQLLIAVDLGPVPDSMDLSYLKQKVSDTVRDILGVENPAQTVAASLPTELSQEEHTALVSARNSLIANSDTDYAKLLKAQSDLVTAQEQVQELENFIFSLTLPPTP